MGESFEKWFPQGDLDSVYDVENVALNHGISVYLIPDGLRKEFLKGQRILLHWDNFMCFQVSDESYREDCWASDRQDVWSFFVSSNSRYLQAYQKKSCLFPENALHFLIAGTNIIVDVLTTVFPDVEITTDIQVNDG